MVEKTEQNSRELKQSSSSIEEEKNQEMLPDNNGRNKHVNALKKKIALAFLGPAAEPNENMVGGKFVLDTIEAYKKINKKAYD